MQTSRTWHGAWVIPWKLIEAVPTPDGKGEVSLHQRGQEFAIRVGAQELMNSRQHGSEEAMAEHAAAALDLPSPRVLIGGLGMGFTVAAANRVFPQTAVIEVAELLPAVIAWNQGPLAHLAGNPLDDGRVVLRPGNVRTVLKTSPSTYDAILLDIDNGPCALTLASNEWLYKHHGLIGVARALRSGGILGLWSASADERFEAQMHAAGFAPQAHWVRARGNKRGARHCIWIARKRGAPASRNA